MAEQVEHVDGEGWISDESEFYGGQEEQLRCEKDVRRRPKRRYESSVKLPTVKKMRIAPTPPLSSSVKKKTASDENVLDFLKSRPQLKAMEQVNEKTLEPRVKERARTVDGKEAEDLIEVGVADGNPGSWQYSEESIDEFLRRAPVDNASEQVYGPWLWVRCPKIPRSHEKSLKAERRGWIDEGAELLSKFEVQKARVEQENPGKQPGTITRKMGPHRDQLQIDILNLAMDVGVTGGKWLLFPDRHDLPRYWRLVATATSEGRLGMVSKVATQVRNETVICVYTYDFSDTADVIRVLNELVELGLCFTSKAIWYKCNAYTYLGIKRDNSYKLPASLFSSKDLLLDEAKALKKSPVAMLKKRSKKMVDYFGAFSGDMDDID